MIGCLRFKRYELNLNEDGFEAKLLPKKYNMFIIILMISTIFIPVSLIIMMLHYNNVSIPHLIIFICMIIIIPVALWLLILDDKKRCRKFSFIVNGNGVTHYDGKKSFLFSWNEIFVFGLIKTQVGRYEWRLSDTQTFIYFSKIDYSINILESRLYSTLTYPNRSNQEIIVLPLWENIEFDTLNNSVVTTIRDYLHKNKIEYRSDDRTNL